MNKGLLLKLSKMILKLASIATDKGELTYEGELEVGTEVFIEQEGEMISAPDGDYLAENQTIVVAEGKIVEIKPVEEPIVEEPVNEPEPETVEADEKDEMIAQLEAKVAELEAVIEEKDKTIAELESKNQSQEEQLKMSAAESVTKFGNPVFSITKQKPEHKETSIKFYQYSK